MDKPINTLLIYKVPPFVNEKDPMLSSFKRRSNLGMPASL